MRQFSKYLVGLLLAGVLLWWVLRGADLTRVGSELLHASPVAVLLCVALNLGHTVFRVWRWRALLEPVRPAVRFRPMFVAVIVGYMTSWVVPGRLGELVRPMLLSARESLPLGPTLGSVVADRLLDATVVVVLFVVGSWVTPLEGAAADYAPLLRNGSLLLALAVAVGVAGMLGLSLSRRRLEPWLGRRSRLLGWLGRTALSLSRGADALRSPRLAGIVALHSLLAWLTIAAGTWFGVRAVGADLSFGAILVILPMLVLGVAVPTPGGAGSYHAAVKSGLMLFGVTRDTAVGAGFLLHVLITIPVIACGVILLWTERISWRELVRSAGGMRRPGGVEQTVENAS